MPQSFRRSSTARPPRVSTHLSDLREDEIQNNKAAQIIAHTTSMHMMSPSTNSHHHHHHHHHHHSHAEQQDGEASDTSSEFSDESARPLGVESFSVRTHFHNLFRDQIEDADVRCGCLLYEKSFWRRRWNTLIVTLVHLNLFVVPFLACFSSSSALLSYNRFRMSSAKISQLSLGMNGMFVLVGTSVIVYLIDIFVRGFTVTKVSFNEFEVRQNVLWRNYLLSFNGLCDLTAVIAPILSLLPLSSPETAPDVRYQMWHRGFMFLLFKSRFIFGLYFPAKFGVFYNRVLRLFRMLIGLLAFINMLACGWKLICDVGKQDYVAQMTWDEVNVLHEGGVAIQDANVWEQYQSISYHVLLLMCGENIGPQTPLEKAYAQFVVLSGLIVTALIVANITYYVKVILQDSEKYHESMDSAELLMTKLRLPTDLQHLVREYMKYRHRKQSMIGPVAYNNFLNSLSDSLRKQVVIEISYAFIQKCWLLDAEADGLPHEAAFQLIDSLEDRVFMPQDVVVQHGDRAEAMFFIDSGELAVYSDAGMELARLGEGSFFGEIALLLNRPRSATVSALTWCNVKVLSRKTLDDVLSDLPRVRDKLKKIAHERFQNKTFHATDTVAQMNKDNHNRRKNEADNRRRRRDSSIVDMSYSSQKYESTREGSSVKSSDSISLNQNSSSGMRMMRRVLGQSKMGTKKRGDSSSDASGSEKQRESPKGLEMTVKKPVKDRPEAQESNSSAEQSNSQSSPKTGPNLSKQSPHQSSGAEPKSKRHEPKTTTLKNPRNSPPTVDTSVASHPESFIAAASMKQNDGSMTAPSRLSNDERKHMSSQPKVSKRSSTIGEGRGKNFVKTPSPGKKTLFSVASSRRLKSAGKPLKRRRNSRRHSDASAAMLVDNEGRDRLANFRGAFSNRQRTGVRDRSSESRTPMKDGLNE